MGLSGLPGLAGVPGMLGQKGDPGMRGDAGYQGLRGASGAQGQPGIRVSFRASGQGARLSFTPAPFFHTRRVVPVSTAIAVLLASVAPRADPVRRVTSACPA